MVDGDLFDKLARIAGFLRKSGDPFGGIQVRSFFLSWLHPHGNWIGRCHRRFLSASPCDQRGGQSEVRIRGGDVEPND